MTSGIMWIPELKDQLNSGQCLLKIGPDHVQKSGGRFSENYYYMKKIWFSIAFVPTNLLAIYEI